MMRCGGELTRHPPGHEHRHHDPQGEADVDGQGPPQGPLAEDSLGHRPAAKQLQETISTRITADRKHTLDPPKQASWRVRKNTAVISTDVAPIKPACV